MALAGQIIQPGDLAAYKTANETVNNNAAFQDDNHLFVSVVANAVYIMDAYIIYNSNTTADIQIKFMAPSGATLEWAAWGQSTGATIVEGIIKNEGRGLGLGSGHGGIGSNLTIRPTGLLIVAGTSGTFRLQWAQNTANASDTVVAAGSWLRLQRIA